MLANALFYPSGMKWLTLLFPMFPFDLPQNIRKPLVFSCFQGEQKRTLERKRLGKCCRILDGTEINGNIGTK